MQVTFGARLKLALRNTLRNRRRTLITVLSVTIGFVALSLFEGYFVYVYRALEDQAVIGERLGHLTLTQPGYYESGAEEPERYSFSAEQVSKLTELVGKYPGVKLVSPRLSVSGLISNGKISRIFLGEAITAEDITILRGKQYAPLPGRLDPGQPSAAVFGEKLARSLGLHSGEEAVLMTSTLEGAVNAVDVKIGAVANTGSVATDDKSLVMPLGLARRLLRFDGADRVIVLLESSGQVAAAKRALGAQLAAAGLKVQIKDWKEVSLYYSQVKGMFDVMYLFISVVVAIVILALVVNTLGLSISERTREIGTLRALGMKIRAIRSLFVLEGLIIVALGSLLGMLATYVLGTGINAMGITYTPPDSTLQADLVIDLLFKNLFGSAFTLTVLAAVASYFPARRGSNHPITEALAHV